MKALRILLTNDDGIHAPGLAVLEEIASQLSDDIWIAAPEEEQSGRGRAISLTHPVRVRKLGARSWAISGTPSDAVLLATRELMPELPDLVLSGVNRGQNIAEDTGFSGTIAAAMFGMQLGIPSIALSQAQNFRQRGSLPWETAKAWGVRAIRPLLDAGWPADVVMNINFPDVEPGDVRGIQVTRQGFRDEAIIHTDRREDLRGNTYFWIGYQGRPSRPSEGTDLRAVYDGYVSVSPLHVDLTHEPFLKTLKETWRA